MAGQPRLITDIVQEIRAKVVSVMHTEDLRAENSATLGEALDQLDFMQNHLERIRDEFLKTIAECTPQEGDNIEHNTGSSSSPGGDKS